METELLKNFFTGTEILGRVITIDGPAASGKTSVSRELAARMGWAWVSTGAFYRGLAFVAKQLNVDFSDEKALSELAVSDRWHIKMEEERTSVFFDGRDVTDLVQQEEIGSIASTISHFVSVRKSLLEAQRRCAVTTEGLVAEGRDCGTVVFPNAEGKIYLTADQTNRAERRAKELGLEKEATVQAQQKRDQQDSTRKAAPLQIPSDALVVDTTSMSLSEVVDQVEAFARSRLIKK